MSTTCPPTSPSLPTDFDATITRRVRSAGTSAGVARPCAQTLREHASPPRWLLLAVHHVVRRLPAAEVVVVHAREVVDEGHGVDHLERAGGGMAISIVPPMSSRAAMVRQADALAAGEERIAHGLVQALGVHLGDGFRERLLDRGVFLLDVRREVHFRGLHGAAGAASARMALAGRGERTRSPAWWGSETRWPRAGWRRSAPASCSSRGSSSTKDARARRRRELGRVAKREAARRRAPRVAPVPRRSVERRRNSSLDKKPGRRSGARGGEADSRPLIG